MSWSPLTHRRLLELRDLKDHLVSERNCAAFSCRPPSLSAHHLLPLLSPVKFDVIVVDDTVPSVELAEVPISELAASVCFVFLWVGEGDSVDRGRQLLQECWGCLLCEELCWIKPSSAPQEVGSLQLLRHRKEHCLLGMRGRARRSQDGHLVHCNIASDILWDVPDPQYPRLKPASLQRLAEHLCLGRRRLHLLGEPTKGGMHPESVLRAGWVTVSPAAPPSTHTFQADAFHSSLLESAPAKTDPWRADPMTTHHWNPYLLGSTEKIEELRPRTPPPGCGESQVPKHLRTYQHRKGNRRGRSWSVQL